jgi:hypothetical protein
VGFSEAWTGFPVYFGAVGSGEAHRTAGKRSAKINDVRIIFVIMNSPRLCGQLLIRFSAMINGHEVVVVVRVFYLETAR